MAQKLDLAFQLTANADGMAAGVAQADKELSKVGASANATSAEFRQAAKITQELRTPTEKYADTIGKLDKMMQKGLLSQEVYGRAVAKADAELQAATSSTSKIVERLGIVETVANRASVAFENIGNAVTSVASAGSSVIKFGEDFARASAEVVAATAAWKVFTAVTQGFRTPEGIWGIATGLSRALVVIKLAEVGLSQLGIEAGGAADFATKASIAFGAFKVGKLYGLDKQIAPLIATFGKSLPAALARVGVPLAATTAATTALGVAGNFVGAQLAKAALMSIPGFGQLAASVYIVGSAFLDAKDRAYEMAAAITAGTVSLETLNGELGQVQAQQVDNLAFAMEEATAAGERSEKAFAGLADVFVTPFIGAFAAIQSGLAGFTDGISGVVEGITSILSPIAQVFAPVATLIGTVAEGVLKLVGVLGEALGVVLKVAGAVTQTFLSPFIVGLTNVVETIRSGMNAAFGYIGERIDWASQKIKDFYAYMSKVPIIGRAFAGGGGVGAGGGGNPAAGVEAVAEAIETQAEATDDLTRAIQRQEAALSSAINLSVKYGDEGFNAAAKYQEELRRLEAQLEAGILNETSFAQAADAARQRFDDQIKAIDERNAAEKKAAEEAARAQEKAAEEAVRAAEQAAKERERIAKEAAAVDEKMAAKQGDIDAVTAERAAALGGKSNEALKANDVRSSEGMSQFIALATGREDPAIAEYRKQTQKLDEIRAELRALQQEKVDILGGAAA